MSDIKKNSDAPAKGRPPKPRKEVAAILRCRSCWRGLAKVYGPNDSVMGLLERKDIVFTSRIRSDVLMAGNAACPDCGAVIQTERTTGNIKRLWPRHLVPPKTWEKVTGRKVADLAGKDPILEPAEENDE